MSLLRSRRFLPLFATQALGALNDNLFKNALAVLVIFRVHDGGPTLVALAGGVFILPYVLFAAPAGQLADRVDKARLIRATKLFEIALMVLAAAGLLLENVPALFLVLFGLGVQATFFGPLKYGILPDHLAASELLRGNGLIEAATFLCILLGTIAGSALIGLAQGAAIVAALGLVVALAGYAAAAFVPPAPPRAAVALGWNIARETRALLRDAARNLAAWRAILGISWFWTIGAVFVAEFPVLAQRDFGADSSVITLMLACFAVGIGAGSVLAARLLGGEISARHVPVAGVALTLFAFGFVLAVRGVSPATGFHDARAMLAVPQGWLALLCLLGAATSGGVFSVPLYAILQNRADPAHRARMIAANNVMNAACMVIGAGAIAGLAALGMRAADILALAAGINLLVALAAIPAQRLAQRSR